MTGKEVCDDCKYYRKSDDYCYYRGYGSKRDCKSYEKRYGIYDWKTIIGRYSTRIKEEVDD